MMAANQQEVVFVLGIAHRSGTNFFRDLLIRHPDCERVHGVPEDFLVANADKLESFASAVAACWNRRWDPKREAQRELTSLLGKACLDFLASKTRKELSDLPRYLVTKTPSVENLESVSLFPTAKAIVIVRDGRAVVESSVRSFGWDFERVAHQWASAADNILAARNAGTHFLLVRYEDLFLTMESELGRVFTFLEIEDAIYDFDAASTLPVKGSSALKTDSGAVHWKKVPKPKDFNPTERWKDWTMVEHQRFNRIAGAQSTALGYDLVERC